MLYGLLDFDPDKQPSVEQWALWHQSDHDEIRQKIQSVFGVNLNQWILYPLDLSTWDAWSLQHQQAHNDMINFAPGVIGSDLTSVDLDEETQRLEWHFKHFGEHRSVRNFLGI